MRSSKHLFVPMIVAGMLLLVFCFMPARPRYGNGSTGRLLSLHHKGVGLINQHKFSQAERVLSYLVAEVPNQVVPWINLGIAQLNQPDEKRTGVGRALKSLKRARELDRDNPRIPYCLGLVYEYLEDLEESCTEFAEAVRLAPNNADAHYKHGACLQQQGQPEQALPHLEASVRLNPRLKSGWYRLGRIYRSLGRSQDAQQAVQRFQVLGESRRGVERGLVYTEMGSLADAVLDWVPVLEEGSGEEVQIRFAAPVTLEMQSAVTAATPFAFVDFDLDCIPELWVGGSEPAVWDLRRSPRRLPAPEEFRGSTSFAIADFSEDGLPDLATGSSDGVRTHLGAGDLQRGLEAGQFLPSQPVTHLEFADLDVEGDIDLVASFREAVPRIAINSGRGFASFKDSPFILDLNPGDRLELIRDLDRDGDPELIFTRRGREVFLVDNEPQWNFPPRPEGRTLALHPRISCLEVGDFDGDGDEDLAVAGPRPGIWWNDGHGNFPGPGAIPELLAGATRLKAADLDLDGYLDLIAVGPNFSRVIRNHGKRRFAYLKVSLPGGVGVAAADVDNDLDPDLVLLGHNGKLNFIRNTSQPRHSALRLYLGGVREEGDRRTNLLGLGARVEVRAGDLLWGGTFDGGGGHRACGLQPLIIGIGPRRKVDSVTIYWPDGVLQAEINVPVDVCHVIKEIQRKASSCPILFTWDGEKYRFITDFMGGGGLGFWIGIDTYGPPDATETVRVEPGALAPIAGEYRMAVMEPMEEVAYIDALTLRVVDHPAEIQVYPDELFTTSEVTPTGKALGIATERRVFPVAALGHQGENVLPRLLEVDRRYPDGWRLDPDLVGYAEPHSLTLSFPESIPTQGDVRLFLSGWVEYPYSRINFAAFQGQRRLEPPTIYWRRHRGENWRVLYREVGYPAGMPKTMVLDINEAVRAGAREFRLVTNMEIYWDSIFLAEVLPVSQVVERTVPMKSALLRFGGYPREYSDDGALPLTYHYCERDPHLSYKAMAGNITRYGEVRGLLEVADDRFVIVGGGDELLLRFDASLLPPLPTGWQRTFLLDTHGYCKDMDPLTAERSSVEPLPFAAMKNYPPAPYDRQPDRRRYQEFWNTRRD